MQRQGDAREAARGGYATSPEELIDRYADLVLRVALSYLGSVSDAEDVCQDVLLRLLERTDGFEGPEHERAWVVRVACNLCRDRLRAERRHPSVPLDGVAEPADDTAETAPWGLGDAEDTVGPVPNGAARVLSAVAQLPPSQRVAVYLHYYEGYTARQIAQVTGERPATVHVHLSRARKRLRTILERSQA